MGGLLAVILGLAAPAGAAQGLLALEERGFGLEFARSAQLDASPDRDRTLAAVSARWSRPVSKRLRLVVEPNAGWFAREEEGFIGGVNVSPRAYLLRSGPLLPFLGLGAGAALSTYGELPSRLNFTLFTGAGLDLRLAERLTLQAEYRLHHISNAGLRQPNRGIDTNRFSLGLSWWVGR